jgi:hypothetical protein
MENLPTAQNANVPAPFVPAAQEQILKSDVVLSKVLLMQALSDFVKERKCADGDIVRSGTSEMLAKQGSELEVIPLTFENLWMLSEDEKGKGNDKDFKFRGYEPRTAANEDAEWDFMQDGVRWKRTKVMNLFALLGSDVERLNTAMAKFIEDPTEIPDVDAALMPVVIQFRKSSFKTAKDVSTLFVKAKDLSQMMGQDVPAYGRTMKIKAVEEAKDDNKFFVFAITSGERTKKEYIPHAKRWKETITQMRSTIKLDDTDLAGGDAARPEPFNNQF